MSHSGAKSGRSRFRGARIGLALVGVIVGGAGVFVLVKDASDAGFPMILVGAGLLATVLLAPDDALERLGEHLPGAIETLFGPSPTEEAVAKDNPGVSADPQPPPPGEAPTRTTAQPPDIEGIAIALRAEDAGAQLSAIEEAEGLCRSLDEAGRGELRRAARGAKPRGQTRRDRRSQQKRIDSLIALLGDE